MGKILLAEDDLAMRRFLHTALEKAGHEVDEVPDGEAALEMIKHHNYDVLVSDIVMPGMDGLELAVYVQNNAPNTKIIFITGFTALAVEKKVDAPLLSKPFHLNDLVKQVDIALGNEVVHG